MNRSISDPTSTLVNSSSQPQDNNNNNNNNNNSSNNNNTYSSTTSFTSNKLKLNDKTFNEKSQIKPWLQKRLAPLNIDIVIERSDDTKIVFKCKYSNHTINTTSKDNKKKKSVCPFRIRANYSIRLKLWSLVIVNDSHNHPIPQISMNDLKSKLLAPQQYINLKNNNDNNIINSSKVSIIKPKQIKKKPKIKNTSLLSQTILAPELNRSFSSPNYPSTIQSLLNNPNDSSINNSLKYQVRRIEDTLKDIENINYIPQDSKEKIFNNVLAVLHNSISEVTNYNVNNTINNNLDNNNNNTILPPISSLPEPSNLNGEKIVLPSICNLKTDVNHDRFAMFGK
jgi:hypothetical protein